MKPTILLATAVVLSIGASVTTTHLLAPTAVQGRDTATAVVRFDELGRSLKSMQEEQSELARTVADLRLQPAVPQISTRVAVEDIDDAIRRWMRENADELVPMRSIENGEAKVGSEYDRFDGAALVALLRDPGLTGDEREALWQRLSDAGRMDDVIEEMERLAEMDANNPDTQVELASAYLHKLFDIGPGPLAGQFAMKADGAFDRALELEPDHWEARFTKAVALSNWPAFLGKSGEAIRQFEILIESQAKGPAKPHHSQSYLFLGNMYQETGESAKAIQAWHDGLARFPEAAQLRRQLDLAGQ